MTVSADKCRKYTKNGISGCFHESVGRVSIVEAFVLCDVGLLFSFHHLRHRRCSSEVGGFSKKPDGASKNVLVNR